MDTKQQLDRIAESVRELGRVLTRCFCDITIQLTPRLHDFQWYLQYVWAESAHPEWVAILNRTKKRRTRKKYRDRIRRAYYMEVVNRGESAETN